jgi:hypothetical protein
LDELQVLCICGAEHVDSVENKHKSPICKPAAQRRAVQRSAVPRSAVQCSAAQRSTLGAPFNHTTKRGDEYVLERIEPARPSRAIVRCR